MQGETLSPLVSAGSLFRLAVECGSQREVSEKRRREDRFFSSKKEAAKWPNRQKIYSPREGSFIHRAVYHGCIAFSVWLWNMFSYLDFYTCGLSCGQQVVVAITTLSPEPKVMELINWSDHSVTLPQSFLSLLAFV